MNSSSHTDGRMPLKVFICTYHRCRTWNTEARAAKTCYLDRTGKKSCRLWIYQGQLHRAIFVLKSFFLFLFFFFFWRVTSCCGAFPSPHKHSHIDQRLSRFHWKSPEITNERSHWSLIRRGWAWFLLGEPTSWMVTPGSPHPNTSRPPDVWNTV